MSDGLGQLRSQLVGAAASGRLWGTLPGAVLPHLRGHGLIAYRRTRDAVDAPWGSAAILFEQGFDPAMLGSFTSYYHQRNVWARDESALRPGIAVASSALFPDAELKQTEFYDGWLKPQDIFSALGGVVHQDATAQVKFSVVRDEKAGPFSCGDIALGTTLMPDLQLAIELNERIAQCEAMLAAGMHALDELETGVFLLGPAGEVAFANAAGAAQLTARRPLRLQRQRLVSDDPVLAEALGKPGARIQARQGATTISVLPAPAGIGGNQRIRQIVMVSDRRVDVQRFAQERHLTGAERDVFLALLDGHGLKEIARQRVASYHTVRSQVASLLTKSGCRSQRELLARFAA